MMSKLEFDRLHPRGPDGRFIRKFGIVKWLDGELWRRGRVTDIQDDGSVKVQVFGSNDEKIFTDPSHDLYVVRQPKAMLNKNLPGLAEWHAPEMGSARPDPAHVRNIQPARVQTDVPRAGMGDTSIQVASGRPVRLGVDSIAAYIDPATGLVTPERRAIHDQIVSHFVDGIPPSADKTFVIMGGGPAAGKSTVLRAGLMRGVPDTPHVVVEADAIKEMLPEAKAMQAEGDNRWATFTHQESAYLAKRVLAAAMERDQDVVLDSTGDHGESYIVDKIEAARKNGYQHVIGEYVTVDTETAIQRARKRVAETGRVVPETTIRGTHRGVSQTLPYLLDDFDETNLYDTSGPDPKLIMHAVTGVEPEILDEERYDAFIAKAHESLRTELAPETAPIATPLNLPGTSVGGMSTNVEALGLDKHTTQLLVRNMKSKGFTLQEAKQAELEEAKTKALIAIADKLGYSDDETMDALKFLNEFLHRWQLTGGQSEERRKMEAAWQRLKRGEPPRTDADRAAAIQKVYTDMTWDTREMGEGTIPLIRGIAGTHAERVALADALGEDWSATTWPLTSWAIPGAETSVKNWVVDGLEIKSNSSTRADVFMMYHAEPLLREKGLKVKGEYVVDGTSAIDSETVSVERMYGRPESGTFYGDRGREKLERYVDEGRRFAEQTGGDSDDYALGSLYDGMLRDSDGFGFVLFENDDSELWRVLGFDGPPASMKAEKIPYDEYDYETYKNVPYAERQTRKHDVNNPQRMAVALDFKEKGLDAQTVGDITADWRNYERNLHEAQDLRRRLALGLAKPGDNMFDTNTGPHDQKTADYWAKDLIPYYDATSRYYAARLRAQRQALGLDHVFVAGLEPAPQPLHGDHHEIPGVGDVDEYLNAHPPNAGEATFEWQSRIVNPLTEEQKNALLFESRERYEPVDFIAEGAQRWRADHGQREPNVDLSEIPVNVRKADAVARFYEKTPDMADDPVVKRAYDEFKKQSAAMWDFMTGSEEYGGLGIKVDFCGGVYPPCGGEPGRGPYTSAAQQAEDLRQNHHITIESGLGGEHSKTMTLDEYDRFRAVHDVFGHAAIGGGFDRHGEYQAYLAHSTMYTADGRRAMATEYHGVNTALWAGDPANPGGTGKSILLPDELIPNPFELGTGELITAAAEPDLPGVMQLAELDVTDETAEALAYLCVQTGIGPDFAAQYQTFPWHGVYVGEMEPVG
jgi:predicted ABC-type ATPase